MCFAHASWQASVHVLCASLFLHTVTLVLAFWLSMDGFTVRSIFDAMERDGVGDEGDVDVLPSLAIMSQRISLCRSYRF